MRLRRRKTALVRAAFAMASHGLLNGSPKGVKLWHGMHLLWVQLVALTWQYAFGLSLN